MLPGRLLEVDRGYNNGVVEIFVMNKIVLEPCRTRVLLLLVVGLGNGLRYAAGSFGSGGTGGIHRAASLYSVGSGGSAPDKWKAGKAG